MAELLQTVLKEKTVLPSGKLSFFLLEMMCMDQADSG